MTNLAFHIKQLKMEPKYKIVVYRFIPATKNIKEKEEYTFNSFMELYNKFFQIHIDPDDQWKKMKLFMLEETEKGHKYFIFNNIEEIKSVLMDKFLAQNYKLWIEFLKNN